MIVDCLLMRKVAIRIGGMDALQAMCFSRPSSLRQGFGMCGSLAVSKEVGRHCFSRWLNVSLETSADVRFGFDFHSDQSLRTSVGESGTATGIGICFIVAILFRIGSNIDHTVAMTVLSQMCGRSWCC